MAVKDTEIKKTPKSVFNIICIILYIYINNKLLITNTSVLYFMNTIVNLHCYK